MSRTERVAVWCFVLLGLAACQGLSERPTSTTVAQSESGQGEETALTEAPEVQVETITPELARGPEQAVTPTGLPRPTSTALPVTPVGLSTIVPSPPITTRSTTFTARGPHLSFVEWIVEDTSIILVDAYQFGHKRIDLPPGERHSDFPRNTISWDGKYFVVHEGSLETGDLTLGLYDLQDERFAIHIPVISSNYEDRLNELAAELVANPPDELVDVDEEWLLQQLRYSLRASIGIHAWSPDGKQLAFAAQIDGPSSDLYVLDLDTMDTRRLTSGRSNIQELSWSPDGRWIMHGSAYWVGAGTYQTNHLAAADGSYVVSFRPIEGQIWHGWANSRYFIVSESENGPGSFDLKLIDVESMETVGLWKSTYNSLAFDPERSLLVFSQYPYFQGDPEPGLYLNKPGDDEPRMISEDARWQLEYLGLEGYPFIGSNPEVGTSLISVEGDFKLIYDKPRQALMSPNNAFIALYDLHSSEGLLVYDVANDGLRVVYSNWVDEAFWREDSRGLFFFADDRLMFYDLESHELIPTLEGVGQGAVFGPIRWANPEQ